MPINDDVINNAIVMASCQADEISNCPEIMALKNMA